MPAASVDSRRLDHLESVIRADVASGLYYGAVLKVAHRGELVFDQAIGSHDAAQTRPLAKDSIFGLFSITKGFTNLLVLRAIELGQFALTTRISISFPNSKARAARPVQIWHLLSRQAGFPIIFEVKPGMYIDRFDEMIAARHRSRVSAGAADTSLRVFAAGESRADGRSPAPHGSKKRSYRQMVQEDLLRRSR